MVLKITNLHIIRYLPTYWLCLLERYTIDNQRCTHTRGKVTGGRQVAISVGEQWIQIILYKGGSFQIESTYHIMGDMAII